MVKYYIVAISTLGLVNYVIILALSSGFQGTENWSIGEKAVSIQCSLIPKCRMCVCVCTYTKETSSSAVFLSSPTGITMAL